MNECDEIAAGMADRYSTALTEEKTVSNMSRARAFVTGLMPDGSAVMIDNVAECLHLSRARQEKLLRDADADARDLAGYWEKLGVIVTISRHPLKPLAMRHDVQYVETRLKR